MASRMSHSPATPSVSPINALGDTRGLRSVVVGFFGVNLGFRDDLSRQRPPNLDAALRNTAVTPLINAAAIMFYGANAPIFV
jgi:hypothetical protein